MQYVPRPAVPPAFLGSEEMQRSRTAMLAFISLERERRAQTSVPSMGVPADRGALVAEVASLTGGRCAFCEAEDELFVHRFRPPGNAMPMADRKDAHLFYVWLADAWQNLYPICGGCRPAEPFFPVDGDRCRLPTPQQVSRYVSNGDGIWTTPVQEANVLLDPCRDTAYDRHLMPRLDGALVALTSRAAATVQTFDLDREDRRSVRARRYGERLDRLRVLLRRPPQGRARDVDDDWSALFDFGRMEFGGTWLLLLKRIARRIDFPGGVGTPSRRVQLAPAFRRLPDADALERAVEDVGREDPRLVPVDTLAPSGGRLRAGLRRIEVLRFRAVERLVLDVPAPEPAPDGQIRAPAMMILGENATGKSSLLEAVALTLASEEARRALAPDWRSMPLDPTQMGSDGGHRSASAQVRLEFDGGRRASLSIADGIASARSDFGSERAAVFAYGAFRRFGDDAPPSSSSRHIRNLFDSTPLPDPEPWLRSLSPAAFAMVVRTLRDLLSIEGDFDVIQRSGRARELRMVTSVTDSGGGTRFNRSPLRSVSSGYRSMLGMLCDILRGLLEPIEAEGASTFEASTGVVLIDEIEAHLHPRWKVQVMTSLRSALPGVTFVVTTHDPLCLRGMRSDEIVVLQRVASSELGVESELPIAVERMTGLPEAADLRVEQLLTSDFFQLFSSNDAASDRGLARVGDLMARRAAGEELPPEDACVLDEFERDVAGALPVGSSEVHRMVQAALAEFLERRRDASNAALAELGEQARQRILSALEAI